MISSERTSKLDHVLLPVYSHYILDHEIVNRVRRKKMATETVGGGMTSGELARTLGTGSWREIVRTPEQQAEHDQWVAECLAASAAQRKERRDEAMKNPIWRGLHWLFQTGVWKDYKADRNG